MRWEGDASEIIIVGGGLGGLVAGTWLSKKNHSVLLLKESGYQRCLEEKGFRFVPFSSLSEKRVSRTFWRKVSQALDLSLQGGSAEEERRAKADWDIDKQDVGFQIILPEARVDLYSQRPLLQREWRREFPKETSQIEKFYAEMDHLRQVLMETEVKEGPGSSFPLRPRSLFRRWRSLGLHREGGIEEKFFYLSKEFRRFLQLQLLTWGNLLPDRFPATLAAYVLRINSGLGEPTSSLDIVELEEKILAEFEQAGGKVGEVERVERIDKKWMKGFTISSAEDRRVFRSKLLILNSPLHRLSKLMNDGGNPLLKWQKRIQPCYLLLPFFLGIQEKVIPVGMKDLLISVLDQEKPLEKGNLLLLSFSPRGDESKAPEGKRALIVESLVPFEDLDQNSLPDQQEGVMKHLRHLFPFLDKHIDFIDHNWAAGQIPRWSYPHLSYLTTSDFCWREGIVPLRISRDLYFVGKETFPYLGLEGEVVSGLMAAEQILQKFR